MTTWSDVQTELVARGATPSANGLVIRERGVRVLLRHTTLAGRDYVMMLVPVARAAECDPARILALGTQLVMGLPIVSSAIVSLRYTLELESATTSSIERAVGTLVNDLILLHGAIGRPAAVPDTFEYYAD